jgi:DHA1 family multidrug resistance protein-like MFS transporter
MVFTMVFFLSCARHRVSPSAARVKGRHDEKVNATVTTANKALVWMCVLAGINQLGFGGVVPALPLYAKSFGVSASAIGMAIGIYGLARFCGAIPAGWLSDGMGRRHALALGGIVTTAGNLWCALASSYPEFILARFVAGAGAGLIVTTGQIVLADITTQERRGRVVSIYQGVFIFAAGVGPFPGGLLSAHYGLTAPFWVYAVAGLFAAGVAYFALGETRDIGNPVEARRGRGGVSFLADVAMLSKQTGFVLACLVSMANAAARTGGLFAIVPLLGTARLGLSIAEIGFALAIGTVIGLMAAYPGGMLTDYFGRKAVIAPSTIISGASMLLFCIAPSYVWFIAANIVWGVASAIGGAAPSVYAADSAPPGRNATTLSIFRMAGDVGYVVGPLALGSIADLFGATVSLIIGAGLMVAAGVAFALWAPETYRGRALEG